MQILLLSMPDSFEHTPSLAIRMPNGALASLAGNIDEPHRVAVADLILAQSDVRGTVERLVRDLHPHVVGLSVMTFQRATARRIISLVRSLLPDVRIVVGGYDPSLAPEAWTDPAIGVDALVRGEGELTFRALVNAWDQERPLSGIPGLWYRDGPVFRKNPARPVVHVEEDDVIRLPNRAARVLSGYTFMGRQVDVVETSRGCTFDCSFCSIIEMRGRNFHPYPIERVLADIANARAHGARAVFIVDDNIMLDAQRFERLCRAIVDAGLEKVDYLVQAMTSTIANHGATLAPWMRKAGFRYVFLGIENVLEEDLQFLKASAKNRQKLPGGQRGNATLEAVTTLRRHGMFVVGGLIVGNPDDTRESIAANISFAQRHIDWPYIQHPTPYPGTPMSRDFRERDLIVNPRVDEYDGTTAVARTTHVDPEDVEFMRWKAERWIKLRHFPVALRHDPIWVLKNSRRMLAHTFRGTTLRSALGLEDPRQVFNRYKSLRAKEREVIDWPDPIASREAPSDPASGGRPTLAAASRIAVLLAFVFATPAAAIDWTRTEGAAHTFPMVRTVDGSRLGAGELTQTVDGNRLDVKIVSAFDDGRCVEERAAFRQQPELIQDRWSWREVRQGIVQRQFDVDSTAGRRER